jgi:hypothetical protein
MKAILADPVIKKALVSISPTSRQNQLMRKSTFRASKTPKRRRYAQEAEQMDAPAPTCSKRFARRSRPTIRYPMIGRLGIKFCPILDNFSRSKKSGEMRVRPRFSIDGCGQNSRLLWVFKSLARLYPFRGSFSKRTEINDFDKLPLKIQTLRFLLQG